MPEINFSVKVIGGKKTPHRVEIGFVPGKKIKFGNGDVSAEKLAELIKTHLLVFIESRLLD